MKAKLFYPFLCLAMLWAFVGCSDDDEVASYQYTQLNSLKLTLSEVSSTSTTFTFDVKASDPEVSYLCLYVDKAVIDKVEKADIPAFLMKDLQQQAQSKGESFESYLSSILHKGDATGMKISNLLPGRLYELVVFGVQGTKHAQQAEYLFFQTLMADPIDCSFDVKSTPAGRTAQFEVKPSVKDVLYHFCTFPKDTYDRISAQGGTAEGMLMEYFQSQLQRVLGSLMQPGQQQPTDEQISQALSKLLWKGDQKFNAEGLSANTEYVWLAAAFKLVEIEGEQQLVMVSNASKGDYKTLELDLMRDFTFDIQVTDVQAATAKIKVTPSLLEEKFIFAYKAHTPETKNLSAEELMDQFIAANKPFLEWLSLKGVQDIDAALVPNKDYYVLTFGYDGGVTSKPALVQFKSLPGGDPEKVTFTHSLVMNTPYHMQAEVVPSDNTVPYIVKFYPDAPDFNLQMQKEMVEAEVAQNYKMQSMFNPGMTKGDFLYRFYHVGTKVHENYQLSAGQSYTLCVFALNLDCKVAATYVKKSFATTPDLSDVTVSGEVAGYFSGDEEAGSIFGNAELTKGRCIIAMKYTPSAGVVSGKTSLMNDNEEFDELNPSAISDKELMSQVDWKDLASHGYSFVMADWNQALNSFSYGVDKNQCEGKISRMAVAAPDKNKVAPIEELKKIVAGLEAARCTRAASQWTPLQPEISHQASQIEVPMPWKPAETTAKPVAEPMIGANLYLKLAHPVK